MAGRSVVPFDGSTSSTSPGAGGNPSVIATPAADLAMVAGVLDVPPLATIPPGGRIPGTPPSRRSASPGKRHMRRAASPYGRPTTAQLRPRGLPLAPPSTHGSSLAGGQTSSAQSAPSPQPPVTIKTALPKEKAPAARPAPVLPEEEEDVGLDVGSPPPPYTRRSRERTQATEQLPRLSSVAKLTPLMKELEASNEKLRAAYSE